MREKDRGGGQGKEAGVMREAVEYAVGIFHGSIMAIQSVKGRVRASGAGARSEFVVSTCERTSGRGLSGRELREAATSSQMRSPSIPAGSRRCFLSVSGQPNGERCVTESWAREGRAIGQERGEGRGHYGATVQTGLASLPSHHVALRAWARSKKRRERAVT